MSEKVFLEENEEDVSMSVWLINFYLRLYIFANFPKQYHALNTVFRLFHSYAKISNIFYKINYDGQKFQVFMWSSLIVKVSKYSIKSEHGIIIRTYNSSMIRGSDSQVYYKKAILKSSKNFTEKNLCMSLFSYKVAGLRSETFFRKRLL